MPAVLFSSLTEEWPTPPAFFAKLNRRYRFTLDPCATPENATCPLFFTKEIDGLKQDWGAHRVFVNPPYGRAIAAWARKSFQAAQGGAYCPTAPQHPHSGREQAVNWLMMDGTPGPFSIT